MTRSSANPTPFAYALIGGISGVIGTTIYNTIANRVGGIQMDVVDPE